jgi:hypothetical protein
MDKRREHRIHKFLKVRLQLENKPVSGSTVDISPMGLRLRLHQRKVLPRAHRLQLEVIDHGRPYHLNGQVAWYRHDFIDNARYIGVALDGPHPEFCSEVLKQDVGGRDLPYQCTYENREQFLADFRENIRHGGLFIDTRAASPPLYERVWVRLAIAKHHEPFLLEGEVVAHTPAGFGLRILDKVKLKTLENWV